MAAVWAPHGLRSPLKGTDHGGWRLTPSRNAFPFDFTLPGANRPQGFTAVNGPGDEVTPMGVNARCEVHTAILGMLLGFPPQSQWDLGRRGKTAFPFATL